MILLSRLKLALLITLSAEPEVPGRTPRLGQSPPLRYSVRIGDNRLQFQSDIGGPVPLGSGFAHSSTSGESLDRVLGVGPEPAQTQGTLAGGPEVAQTE